MPKGFIKYIHPEMEIELLVSAIGKSTDKPFPLKMFNTNAQRLRYLDIIEKHPTEIDFHNLKIIAPQPAALVINKLITSRRRKQNWKKEKDRRTVKELGELILAYPEQKALIKEIFLELNPKFRSALLKEVESTSPLLGLHLKS